MATTLEIIRGISQAMANNYDGATDQDGERVKIGLKREEGETLVDSRVMDGFSVKVSGNELCVSYQCDIKLKDLHNKNFESEVESMIESIVSFLKKEFRKATKSSLSLKKISGPRGECCILAQNISRMRSTITATKRYEIGNLEVDPVRPQSEDRLDDSIRKFLELGKNK
jgi:hypothetical protein